jgi:trans-2-enoyl-CoA reductase
VAVNPCSAWRMLHDFVKLQRGDVIVQNGANSGVGQAVIQLGRHLGIRTINILRDRPNFNETVERLKSLGADFVVSEQFVSSIAMKKMMEEKKISKPVLGLNCVGGDTSVEIARMLAYVLYLSSISILHKSIICTYACISDDVYMRVLIVMVHQ